MVIYRNVQIIGQTGENKYAVQHKSAKSAYLLAADSSFICPNVVVCLLFLVGVQVEKSLLTAC